MRRAFLSALLAAGLAWPQAAWAEPAADPPIAIEPDLPHRYSIPLLGGIGGAALASALIGGALIANSHNEFIKLTGTGPGASCRPCSAHQLAAYRGNLYGGVALVGVGGVLLITDIVLIVLDKKFRDGRRGGELATVRDGLSGVVRF